MSKTTQDHLSDLIEFLSNFFPRQPSSNKLYKQKNNFDPSVNSEEWFRTSPYGGICLNVFQLYKNNVRHYDVDMKVEYLKNLTISNNLKTKITGKIILISNFGVVDGHDFYLKEQNQTKKSILLFEFKDAYPYFYDASDTDFRLKNIIKANLHKYSPVIVG